MAGCGNTIVKGRDLQDIWYESTSSEVYFKAKHIPVFPWGEDPNWPSPKDRLPYQGVRIEAAELCHVTHIDRLAQIKTFDGKSVKYVLKPLMKMGKEGYFKGGELLGATYTPSSPAAINPGYYIAGCTPYRRVSPQEPVLPGYYIWWSVNLRYPPSINGNRDADDYEVSDIFSDPPTSIYGSMKISVMSYYILRSYQDAFARGGNYPRLEFRCGGTLRYKHEICYVVIVCAQGHFTGALDAHYPRIPGFNIRYNDHNGRITFVEKWKVTIRNGITLYDDESFSWDHSVLAFHYPSDKHTMTLWGGNTREEPVQHDFCIKRSYINGEFVCPDEQYTIIT